MSYSEQFMNSGSVLSLNKQFSDKTPLELTQKITSAAALFIKVKDHYLLPAEKRITTKEIDEWLEGVQDVSQ